MEVVAVFIVGKMVCTSPGGSFFSCEVLWALMQKVSRVTFLSVVLMGVKYSTLILLFYDKKVKDET